MIIKERYDANFNGKLLVKKNENGRFYTSVKVNENTNKNVVFFDLPMIAHISATKNCNLNCYYCYAIDKYSKEDMSFDEYLNVLDQCNENGVLILYWSGGEPFSNPYFIDLLEYAHKLGFYQTILSNATQINDVQIERMKYLNIGFQISFNGIWEENKEGWLLDEAIRNTFKLIESNISTIVTIIVKKFDKEKIIEIIEVCIQNNINNIRFGYELPIGLNENMNKIEYMKNNKEFFKEFEVIKNDYLEKINISWQSEGKKRSSDLFSKRMLLCEAGTSQLYIDNNGDVYPCPLFKSYQEFNCGNVKKDNFRDIWHSENMKKIRSFDLSESNCSKCDVVCGSWCRGLAYSYSQNIEEHPQFCIRSAID